MTPFEQILLRLKERLGVQSDKEVAALLGLTDKAFNARKKRDAFPEDKLLAMVVRTPGLDLDVDYVLTGDSARMREFHRRLHAVREGSSRSGDIPDLTNQQRARVQAEIAMSAINALASDEQLLIGDYRRCDMDDRSMIRQLAARCAGASSQAPSAPTKKPSKGPKVQQNFHSTVDQVAGGNIVNKGPRKR
jgi:hypothetical protein